MGRPCSVRYPYQGQSLTVKELAEIAGLATATVRRRLARGWTPEHSGNPHKFKAGRNPSNVPKRTRAEFYPYQGQLLTLRQLAELVGLKPSTIKGRLKKGWSVERAVVPLTRPSLTTHILEGETTNHREMAETSGLTKGTIISRLKRGWTPSQAVTSRRFSSRTLVCREKRSTPQDLASQAGITPQSIRHRLIKGLSAEQSTSPYRLGRLDQTISLNGTPISKKALGKLAGISEVTVHTRLKKGLTPEQIVALGDRRLSPKGHVYKYVLGGVPCSLSEVARHAGISSESVSKYLNKGFTPDQVVARCRNFFGEQLTLQEAAEVTGVNVSMLKRRITMGMTLEEAAFTNPRQSSSG